MNEVLPTPPRKPKRYEFKATDCVKHEGRCAMRRERHVKGPFECVYCANERAAAELLAPQTDLAPAALSVTEQTPPAAPSAVEAAMPADEAERGGGAACSKPTRFNHEVGHLCCGLEEALRAWSSHKITDERLGLELLRISNELATESKRLRKPHEHAVSRTDEAHVFGVYTQHCDCGVTRTHEVRPSLTAIDVVNGPWRAHGSAPRASEVTPSGLALFELDRCPECRVLEGRHAHDCVTGDKAFEAYEALRAAPPDDACKCIYHDGGHRVVNRFCPLHGASEWQTLAEQRSELHEDGTPRAGCGYCASTPELDARERGLR